MSSWRSWTWSLALLCRRAGCRNSWMPWTPTMPPSLPPVPRRGRRRRGRGGSSLRLLFLVLVQFLGKVVVPVLCNDRVVVRQCRKPYWCCSCSSSKFVCLPSCRRGSSPRSCLFNTIQTPQLQSVRWSMPRAMPVVVPTGAHGSGTAENCGGASSYASVFIALLGSQWTCIASVTEAV